MTAGNLQGRAMHERSLELAAAAIDYDLTPAELGDLESHIAGCPTCARRAAAMRHDASRLGRPLALLPSSRVDRAVAAEIAHEHRRPARIPLLVAAALLLIALLGAIAAGSQLVRMWQTLPIAVVPVPSPTAAAVDASPRPSAAPEILGATWQSLTFAPGSDRGSMAAVAFAGSGPVTVGRGGCVPEDGEPTECYASGWTMDASSAWTRVPDQPGLAVGPAAGTSGPPATMSDVAAGPGGIVGIGHADDGRPRIWRSSDGRAWERTELVPGSPVSSRVASIVASGRGYVIVGWIVEADGTRGRAAAWTSPDGTAWTRATDSAGMDVGPCLETGEEPTCGGMLAVASTPSGFVAVGHDRKASVGTGPSRPAAWTSPDGQAWTRSDAGLGFDGWLSGVSLGGPGLVAVGTICQPDCSGVAAASADGTDWSSEPVSGAAGLEDVTSTDDATFALGILNEVPVTGPRGELQLWRRDAGGTWQRVPSLPTIPDAEFYRGADITAASGRLLIVGSAQVTGGDGEANFSYSSPPVTGASQPVTSPSPVASTAPTLFQLKPPVAQLPAQAGATGLTWTLAHTDANTYATAIAHGPAGWLHVLTRDGQIPTTPRIILSPDLKTWSDVTPAEVRVGCVSLAASRTAYLSLCDGLWRSTDGRTWAKVATPPIPDGTLKGDARAFFSDGTTFLATTGFYPSSDGVWVSPDGAQWTKVHLPGAPRVIVDAVAGRSSGGYVIAGRAADTEAELDASGGVPVWYTNPGRQALWASDDGVTWRSIPLGDVFADARITGLAADGPGGGFLAVGHIGEVEAQGGDPDMAVWRSEDGVTWVQLMGPAFDIRETNLGDARVAGLSDRWLVFASRRPGGSADATTIGVVAGSEDGTTWWSSDPIRGSGPPSSSIQDLTTTAGRLVVLDNIDTGTRIWVSP